jgi:ADP-ribose pyrophosphatase YjhB (NUDIX family)
LVRRCDNGNWELPGGRVEFGESAEEAAIREVAEECGLLVAPTRLAGVYSDPEHVMVYPDSAEVRQQFAVCFHADFLSGTPRPDRVETSDAAWIDPRRLSELAIHPSIRLRINDAVTDPDNPHHR